MGNLTAITEAAANGQMLQSLLIGAIIVGFILALGLASTILAAFHPEHKNRPRRPTHHGMSHHHRGFLRRSLTHGMRGGGNGGG